MRRPYQLGNPQQEDLDAASARARRKGSAFDAIGARGGWERCIVRGVNPDTYSCDVFTTSGKYLTGLAWPGGARDIDAPRRGDTYGVQYDMGVPLLFEVATDVPGDADQSAFRLTPARGYGAEDPLYAGKGENPQRGDRPSDVLPGDWVRTGDMGNLIGVLSGGMTVVKATELAQIIAAQARNLVRIVGQNLELFTGAGSIECKSENGKTSFVMRLGADAATESTPDEENFRVRCELGDEGELCDFRITDGQGRDLYRMHVDPDGRVQKVARRETATYDEDRRVEVGTNDALAVGGDQFVTIDGSKGEDVGGAREVRSGGATRVQAGGDLAMTSMHDMSMFAARFLDVKVGGQLVGTGPAMRVAVNNGDVQFNVGDPRTGDGQIRRSSFKVNTTLGDITFATVAGRFEVNTTLPGAAKVGGPGPGVFSAVLFEHLRVWTSVFGALIDTHTHLIPALGGSPTGPPAIPPYQSSQGLLQLARSNFVKFGG